MRAPILLDTPQRFGMLVAVERVQGRGRMVHYRCDCDCGGSKVVSCANLRHGYTKSCGCATVRLRHEAQAAEAANDDDGEDLTPRLVPATWRRPDTAIIGAILIALRLPFDELSFLSPIDAELLRDLAGLDEDDLDRVGLRRWLRADAHGRVFGIRASASDVFGAASVGERVEREAA